ncbi:5'(3')-nucleotidase/polyphosphatase [Salinisphaera dokdonensis CL-ES53]|uniref:5'-nucleotidase SurE n=1 Tax=Salinisphaera dokdonensis CL-ES53 TaxID=1304272 RepID=A0ABV2B388_9GAMM
MRLLLSNDDGCHAPGLTALRAALAEISDDLVTVAPDRNRSGASNSLTLERPLRVNRVAEGLYSVDGTPTDCVHLATTGLFEQDADMVVSGINHGANLGDDVLYSGTVAAATEGRSLGLPAVAISLMGENPRHFDTAARVAVSVVRLLIDHPLPNDTILNVNVPDLAFEELDGFAATRLGNRHRAERLIEDSDPRGRPIFWIGRAGGEADAGPGTDFHAVAQGKVSITPIQIDLTQHNAVSSVGEWVQRL